ncbi:YybH family protein [Nocardia sp. NPDC050175]|uniref:YybH family protein n=1 Tax=Nocardia sp. NPDC050175 TaxID=3364317 RepID=UPI00379B878E
MSSEANAEHGRARRPEDLGRLFAERLNAGDVDGVVALYEPDAALAMPGGRVVTGTTEIRAAYEQLVAQRPTFAPGQQLQPTLLSTDLALISARLPDGAIYVEVARRQFDETWLWVLDHANIVGSEAAATAGT